MDYTPFSITPEDSANADVEFSAYAENGSVLITASIPAGKSGALYFDVPAQFSPRVDVHGGIGYPSTETDFGKILSSRIESSGKMMI